MDRGGSVSRNTLTLDSSKPANVTYKYETRDGKYLKVTSNVTYNNLPTPGQAVLTLNVKGGQGSVTPASATVEKVKPVEVTFNPETNYEIDTVTLDDTDVKSQVVSNKLTVTMDKSKTLTVKFKLKTITPLTDHDININPTTNGTVTADKTKAAKGEIVTLTITPDAGYEVDEISVMDDDASNVPVTDNKFTMPDMLVNVTVTFKEKSVTPTLTTYTLTASVDGGHGTVTPTTATKNKDETVTLRFTPDTGYELDTVTVNGTAVGVMGNVLDVKMD